MSLSITVGKTNFIHCQEVPRLIMKMTKIHSIMCIARGYSSGIIFCMGPANERQCYIEMSFLISWAHTQNDPCLMGANTTM